MSGFVSSFYSNSNGAVFHVPRITSKKSSNPFQIFRRLYRFLGLKCWNFSIIHFFRSAFSYLTSKILHILHVELIELSDSRHLSTYKLIMDSSGLTILSVKDLKSYLLNSAIVYKHPSCGPSPLMLRFSENFRSSPGAVSKYLPIIISYLLLVLLSTWHFHDTILVALNSDRHKYTFTLFEFVNFPDWVSHVVTSSYPSQLLNASTIQ